MQSRMSHVRCAVLATMNRSSETHRQTFASYEFLRTRLPQKRESDLEHGEFPYMYYM